jgi:PIN domain nuclease of toxin-antitoxin system
VSVLLDAFALIALLTDEPAAETVEVLLRRGDAAMTVVNLAEALDVLRRIEKVPCRSPGGAYGAAALEVRRVASNRRADRAARGRHSCASLPPKPRSAFAG